MFFQQKNLLKTLLEWFHISTRNELKFCILTDIMLDRTLLHVEIMQIKPFVHFLKFSLYTETIS